MNLKAIKTKKDYKQAMSGLEKIFDAKPGTPEGDELKILGILIEKYESIHFPVDYPGSTKNKSGLQESINQISQKKTRKVKLRNL
jgi:antitoxin component HigA of HigAB toxin-antitoxin module